jgi:hypothetical protein
MKKYYFELDKVRSITLTYEKDTEYEWFPEVPENYRKFLGIVFEGHGNIPAGWSTKYYEDNENYNNRRSSGYFAEYQHYRVDELNKKIFYKCHVEVTLSYKHSFGTCFNSTEEGIEWVNKLIEDSGNKFAVIINK